MTSSKPSPATMRVYAETEDGATVVLPMRQHRNYGRRFKTMFEQAMAELSKLDRPSVYWRVLMHLLATADPVQFRRISAREICEATGISMASAERALAMLEADRVIFCQGLTGAKARRLNNGVVWAANSEKWNETERDAEVIDGRGR